MPASRAYSSYSGGAACHGATRGQPRGQGVIPRRFKRKKIFVTHTEHRTPNGWTHRREGGNSDVDGTSNIKFD